MFYMISLLCIARASDQFDCEDEDKATSDVQSFDKMDVSINYVNSYCTLIL